MTEFYPEDLDFMDDDYAEEYDEFDDFDEMDEDDDYGDDDLDGDFDPEEAEDLIDELLGDAEEGGAEDLGDFFWRRKRRRRRARKRRPVRTASRRRSYKPPASSQMVTQKQLRAITGAQDRKIARNASGIKTVNRRLGGVSRRVSGLTRVNSMQSRQIRNLRTRLRTDAAIDVATAFEGQNLDLGNIARAAAKFGAFDKGALSNPYLIGGLVFLLQRNDLLRNLFAPPAAQARG